MKMQITLNIFETMALVTAIYYLGKFLRTKVNFLSRYCIPAPVVGGLVFAIITLILKLTNLATITLDTTLQNLLMTMFFASVGFTASFKILKNGGIKVIMFLGLAILLIVFQDIVGASLAKLFDLNPLLGLCTGSISMIGGHGTAGSFGPLLEDMGISGATTVSFAAATFGLVMGSFIGGFVAKTLIDNKKLKTPKESNDNSIPLSDFHEDNQVVLCQNRLMKGSSFLFLSMGIGSIISGLIQGTGLTFPSYIGAMIAVIGNISLGYFLCIALMGLKLWELFDLALPLIVMLLAQSILMAIFAYFIIFSFMGKDYDAAVFASASCGFGMGATPNAVANMDALSNKYGFAPTPYLVVPIVGALFVDFVNSAVITLFVNILT